jgi:hypothetical protein
MDIREFASIAIRDAQRENIKVEWGYQEQGRPWQCIFRANDGKDYCRETRDADETVDDIREWAQAQCVKHGLAGVRIERW